MAVESQGVAPNIKTNSIQYRVIQRLMDGDYDIIYDDDNAGEIADVITLKQADNEIHIELYLIPTRKIFSRKRGSKPEHSLITESESGI